MSNRRQRKLNGGSVGFVIDVVGALQAEHKPRRAASRQAILRTCQERRARFTTQRLKHVLAVCLSLGLLTRKRQSYSLCESRVHRYLKIYHANKQRSRHATNSGKVDMAEQNDTMDTREDGKCESGGQAAGSSGAVSAHQLITKHGVWPSEWQTPLWPNLSSTQAKSKSPSLRTLPGVLRYQPLDDVYVRGSSSSSSFKLPSWIGTGLPQLRKLSVSWTALTEIPPEIGQLTHLQTLRIYHSKLTHLCPEVASLTNLECLEIADSQITEMPDLSLLVRLRRLNVSGNRLVELPRLSAPHLRELKARRNLLSGTLTSQVLDLPELEELDVRDNQLEALPAGLDRLRHLRTLQVGCNRLQRLPDALPTALKLLHADHNQIAVWPASVSDMKALDTMDLSNNALVDVPDALVDATALRSLRLNSNAIQDLPYDLCTMTHLSVLTLAETPVDRLFPHVASRGWYQSAAVWFQRIRLMYPDGAAMPPK
eukprot:m.94259 g.94259  ORF g.94259 m.94259 type:complete len:483 (+) comp15116_c0_seq1:135-1583(+)